MAAILLLQWLFIQLLLPLLQPVFCIVPVAGPTTASDVDVSKAVLMILYIYFLLLLLLCLRPLLTGDVIITRVFCLLRIVLLRQLLLWRLCHIELFLLLQLSASAC